MSLSRVTIQQNPINISCSFGMYRCIDKRYKSMVKSSVHVVASIVTPVLHADELFNKYNVATLTVRFIIIAMVTLF